MYMDSVEQVIDSSYESFYAKRTHSKVYPTEFVVRTFLAQYPNLKFKKPLPGDRVLDSAFGDGRNTAFLCEQDLNVSGFEISQSIVDQTNERLKKLGHRADLRVGRNSHIPWNDTYFDYILACSCCYYCDEGNTLADNLIEYARVLKSGGYFIASVASKRSFIFRESTALADGSFRITADPYGCRNGYRLHAFGEKCELEDYFSPWFMNFSFGMVEN